MVLVRLAALTLLLASGGDDDGSVREVSRLGRKAELGRLLGAPWGPRLEDFAETCRKLPGCAGECDWAGPPIREQRCEMSPLAEHLWPELERKTGSEADRKRAYVRAFIGELVARTRSSLKPEQRARLDCAAARLQIGGRAPDACQEEDRREALRLVSTLETLAPDRVAPVLAAFCGETEACVRQCARSLHPLLEGNVPRPACAELEKVAVMGDPAARARAASEWGQMRLAAYLRELLPSLSGPDQERVRAALRTISR